MGLDSEPMPLGEDRESVVVGEPFLLGVAFDDDHVGMELARDGVDDRQLFFGLGQPAVRARFKNDHLGPERGNNRAVPAP